MKLFSRSCLCICLFAYSVSVSLAQENASWSLNPFSQKVFIENRGQFASDVMGVPVSVSDEPVQYAARHSGVTIYFTANGVVFRHDEHRIYKEEQEERIERQMSVSNSKRAEKAEKKFLPKSEFMTMVWEGSNPQVKIIAGDPERAYFTYADLNNNTGSTTLAARAYKKIIYKELYPGIDVEYFFPDGKEGFKYNIILHPGADPRKIRMYYKGGEGMSVSEEGDLFIQSRFGLFTDHAPVVFDETGKKIRASFAVKNNAVSFRLEEYNQSLAVTIDPWTTTPTFSGANKAYDLDWDYQGNVYIYGGSFPYQLIKLNSSGAIQWTYTTSGFTTNDMYGDFAVDRNNGTSYVCEGLHTSPGVRIAKVNTAGSQTGLFPGDSRVNEFSRVAFNSCTRKGVIGCGNTSQTYQAALFDTNMTSITPVNVLSTSEAFHDIAIMALDDTNCYLATSISLSYIPNFNNTIFKVPVTTLFPPAYIVSDGHAFQEYTNTSYVSGIRVSGFNGMAKSRKYIYTYDGNTLRKRNPWSGALISTVTVGGTTFQSAGIAVDNCENIFLGSSNAVLKYDSSLTLIASSPTPGAVHDLSIGSNGEIYAAGNAFVTSFTMNACPPAGNNVVVNSTSISLCQGNSVTLSASGGNTYTWNTGATTSSIVVSPTVTTNYTVVGTGACVRDTNYITVNVGPPVSPVVSSSTTLCSGNSATLTASGGASFSWSSGQTSSSIVVTPQYTTTYSVTIANGACASTLSTSVGVSPTPVISATVNPPAVCPGDSIQLTTLFQLGCGTHSSVCSGPTTTSQLGTLTTYTNTAGATPFAGQTTSARMQYLYLASELAAAGLNQPLTISQIGFNIQSLLGTSVYQNFTIKMGCTSAAALTTAYAGGLSVVYTPKNTPALVNGTNYFVLDNKYDWDGSSNIIVEICFNNSTASLNAVSYYTATGFNSVIAATGASVCNSASGTLSVNRPTTYFRHCVPNTGSGFTFSWSPSASLTNSTIANPVAFPTTTTTYTVTTTDAATSCVSTATVTVNVGTPFSLSSSNDTTTCQTSGIQITAIPSVPGNYSYTWSPSSSLSNSSISNPVATPIGTTTYVVQAQLNGCADTDTVVVTIPYLYNFFVTPSADSICIGQSVQLSSLLQNVCGVHTSTCASTYTAQVGTDPTNSSNNNITLFVGSFNSSRLQYLYRASELNAAGITGASTITQFGFNVAAVTGNNVYQNFTIKMGCTSQSALTATYITGLQTVYNPKPCVISNGVNYLSLDNTYDWDGVSNIVVEICFNNAVTSPNSSVYYSTTSFQSGLYYSSASSACAIATGTTVATRPNSYFRSCAGAGLSTLLYAWVPSSTLSDDSIFNPIATPSTVTTYVLTATDTVTGCVFSDSSVITASPIFTTTSTNGVINCTTTGVQINASATPPGTYSYSWSPSATLSNPNISNPMASPAVTTTYTVVVTSAMGCSVSDTVTVSVFVPSLFSFNVIPPIDTICSGSSVALNALIQKGCGANASVCGGPVSTSQAGTSALFSNSTTITPFAGSVNSARYQFLYKASELIAGGMTQPTTITQLGLNIQSIVGSNSYQNFTIKMGCTATNSLTATYITSLPTVYNAKPTAIFNGINYFTLDNTYDWDGVSNIVVEICFLNAVVSQNSYVYYSTTTYPSSLYTTGASVCATLTGTTGTARPNTYFRHCGASGGASFNYLWSPAGSLSSNTVANPIASPTSNTTYTLTATDTASGCAVTDTSLIIVLGTSTSTVNLGNDQTLCPGNNVTLNAGSGFSSYQWSTGATTSVIVVSSSGTYWAVGTNMCGTDRDTVAITYLPVNSLSLGPDISLCAGSSATLTATATGFTGFLWSTGASTSSITINAPGTYWVSSSNSCGSGSDTIVVTGQSPPPAFYLGNDTTLCPGVNLTLSSVNGAYSYIWSTGASGSAITVGTAGQYWASVTNACGSEKDTINVSYFPVSSLSLGPDTGFCSGGSVQLQVSSSGYTNYLWSTGSTATSITVSSGGSYWVSSSNNCGSASDTINVTVLSLPVAALGADTVLCTGVSITLNAGTVYGSYSWSTGASTSVIAVTSPGTYWVNVTNPCGTASDTINISYYPPNSLALGADTVICSGDSVMLALASTGFANFTWNTGSTATSITVSQAGSYWVSSSNLCGSASDTIQVGVTNFPSVSLGNDTAICTSVQLTASSTNAGGYIWSSGATTSGITVSQPGIYWVAVTNACGTDSDTIVITQGAAPVFSLGNDSVLCPGQVLAINLTGTGTSYIWQDSTTLPSYVISSGGLYWVVVTNAAGCTAADSIAVSYSPLPSVFAGPDTVICNGHEVVLVPVSTGSYFWNTGVSDSPITVGDAGVYVVYTSNNCGTASDSVRVTVEKCTCFLDLPNAFSPNDDAINDIFYVRGDCEFILKIYDRWGEKVFETTATSDGWNGIYKGKKMNSGVFNYHLIIEPDTDHESTRKGNISLIR